MMIERLSRYMKARAAHESVEWRLADGFLQAEFDAGTRTFFGVTLNDRGTLLSDEQQPEFFQAYHAN